MIRVTLLLAPLPMKGSGQISTLLRCGARLMKRFDFSLFTDRQLDLLSAQVAAEIAHRRELASRLMRNRGGLVEGAGPRYRNPQNAAQTWSGRGRRPAWIEAALAAGRTLESLEVTDDRPAAKGS